LKKKLGFLKKKMEEGVLKRPPPPENSLPENFLPDVIAPILDE